MSDSAAFWLGRLAAAADQVVWLWERGEDDDDVAILDLRQVLAEVTERFDHPPTSTDEDDRG